MPLPSSINKKKEPAKIRKIHNSFIESALKNSSLYALKIMYFLSIAVDKIDDIGGKKIHTLKLDYNHFLIETKISQRDFLRSIKKLQGTVITFFDDDKKWQKDIVLLPAVYRVYGSSEIVIDVYQEIAKLLIDVQKEFAGTYLNIDLLLNLKSKHTLRILPLLHMIYNFKYPAQRQKTYSLEELNEQLDTNYKNFHDLKKRVLDPAQLELNRSAKMTFEYKINLGYPGFKKTGRPKALSITLIPVKRKYVQQSLM